MPPSATIHHLLVVDDDPLVCELLLQLLQKSGFEVTAAHSGEEALVLLAHSMVPAGPLFDAVLTDLQMPGTDGLELARHIRELTPSPLLIGMSARQPNTGERDMLDDFLLKPFNLADLQRALDYAASVRNLDTAKGKHSSPPSADELTKLKSTELPETGSSVLDTPAKASFDPAAEELPPLNKVLDLDIFTKLRSALGLVQLTQLYEMTANDVDSRLTRMRASFYVGNQTELRQEAHAIKGGCAMVGALELSRLAAQAEAGPESDLVHLQEMSEACIRLRQVVTIVPL